MIKGVIRHSDDKSFYGNIGEFAFEYNGEKFYVGDTTTSNFDDKKEFIVNDGYGAFVMGFESATKFGKKEGFNRYDIKKYKSYTELKDGEKHGCLVVNIKYLNENKRIKE